MPPDQPNYQPGAPAGGPLPPSYDFILQNNKPSSQKPINISNQSSVLKRVVIVVVGLIVLLVAYLVVKGLLSNNTSSTGYVSVIQDQQAIIALITNASSANQLSNLPIIEQNLAATAQLSLASNQSALIKLLEQNGKSVGTTIIAEKVDSSFTTQLSNAQLAGDYDNVFNTLLSNELTTYKTDLRLALTGTTDKSAQTLLKGFYTQAQLLTSQLS